MLTPVTGVAGGRRTLLVYACLSFSGPSPKVSPALTTLSLTDSSTGRQLKLGEVSSLKPKRLTTLDSCLTQPLQGRNLWCISEANDNNLTTSLRKAFVSFLLIFFFPP